LCYEASLLGAQRILTRELWLLRDLWNTFPGQRTPCQEGPPLSVDGKALVHYSMHRLICLAFLQAVDTLSR